MPATSIPQRRRLRVRGRRDRCCRLGPVPTDGPRDRLCRAERRVDRNLCERGRHSYRTGRSRRPVRAPGRHALRAVAGRRVIDRAVRRGRGQPEHRRPSGEAASPDGLSRSVLNEAEIEPDWEALLAYESGRLALYTGDPAGAVRLLQMAVKGIAEEHSSGRVTKAAVRRLLEEAQDPHALQATPRT